MTSSSSSSTSSPTLNSTKNTHSHTPSLSLTLANDDSCDVLRDPNDPYSVPFHSRFSINKPPRDRPVRIYCDGIYDLFHFGHARALQQAKQYFPSVYLIVGVCSEEDTHKFKGKTVFNGEERAESLRHCKWVDEVVADAPWIVTPEFIEKYEIDYIAHDDIPYESAGEEDVYAYVKAQGKFLPTQRTKGVSTSDLITRIVRDYDQYLRRNLARGISPQELNISFLKEKELRVKDEVKEFRDSVKRNWEGTRLEVTGDWRMLKEDVLQTFKVWENKGEEWVSSFGKLFGGKAGELIEKLRSLRGSPSPSPHHSDSEGGEEEEEVEELHKLPPSTSSLLVKPAAV